LLDRDCKPTLAGVTSESAILAARSFAWLAEVIRAQPCAKVVRLVAIDGRAGSGKSTFAKRLSEALGGAPVLPIDDFLAWDDLTEFWPRLEAEVLVPLLAGRDARYQQRDWERDPYGRALGAWTDFPFAPTVIIEGVGAARRATRGCFAYSIWIETPEAVCLERGVARDGEERRALWLDWQRREAAFFDDDPVMNHVQLMVDGQASANSTFRRATRALAQPPV
jgi:hypothetical protein